MLQHENVNMRAQLRELQNTGKQNTGKLQNTGKSGDSENRGKPQSVPKATRLFVKAKTDHGGRRDIPFPKEETIARLAATLAEQLRQEKIARKYAPVKQVLTLLAAVGAIGFIFVAPKAAPLFRSFVPNTEPDWDEWKRFNTCYLRRTLARLRKQKLVKIEEKDGYQVVTITQAGQQRILRYTLENLQIPKPKHWDGRWRVVIYDVPDAKKALRNVFRDTLRSLGFYRLQESVWLYPYPCEREVTFLREYYGVGANVLYLVCHRLEDDQLYREYFGLS